MPGKCARRVPGEGQTPTQIGIERFGWLSTLGEPPGRAGSGGLAEARPRGYLTATRPAATEST